MDYPQLLNLFERSAAIRLLKSNSAPFVIYFFYKQFKHSGHQAAISLDMFLHQLENALTYHQEGSYPLSQPPQTYLREWIKDGYLRAHLKIRERLLMGKIGGYQTSIDPTGARLSVSQK